MSNDNQNMNIPHTTVSSLVKDLTALYQGAVRSGLPFKDLPSPFLWGPPGIGKSDGVRELANELEKSTGKTVHVTDVRLLLFSPVDLRGVPIADEHRQFTNWLKPRLFEMDPSTDVINLLFLDELSAAPQSVQAAAYQITLDRRVGEHALPDNCIVIAAGNRTTDQSVSYKMPKALCNRLMHDVIESDFISWKHWALQNNVDRRIIGFLSFDNSRLCSEPESSDLAYTTPRSWVFVSSILSAACPVGGNVCEAHQLISACVGIDAALDFESWCQIYDALPAIDDIFHGICNSYPKKQDQLYALATSLASAIASRGSQIRQEHLENACTYASKFPSDFAMAFFKDLNALDSISLKLMKCHSLHDWLSHNKQYL